MKINTRVIGLRKSKKKGLGEKPLKIGPFGPIWTGFKNKGEDAIRHLMQVQTGECPGALYNPTIGHIDLVWGEWTVGNSGSFGLKKIIGKHGQEFTDAGMDMAEAIPKLLKSPKSVVIKVKNRYHIENEALRVVVKSEFDQNAKKMVLTGFVLNDFLLKKKGKTLGQTSVNALTVAPTSQPAKSISVHKGKMKNNNSKKKSGLGNYSFGVLMIYNAQRDGFVVIKTADLQFFKEHLKPAKNYFYTEIKPENAQSYVERYSLYLPHGNPPFCKVISLATKKLVAKKEDSQRLTEQYKEQINLTMAKKQQMQLWGLPDYNHPLGYLGFLQNKFSETKQIDRSQIITRPDLFQNRQGAFSQETVNKILSEGFDKSQEPIAVWFDEKANKFVVISDHSRWHASELLYDRGQKDLKTMPVKVFNGDLEAARDYALLESNRSGTAENLKEDIAAYKRAVATGKDKKYLLSIFKTEAKVRMLEDFSVLNPKGRFMEHLGEDSEKSFPFLVRNAQWTGILRKRYPGLSDSHEREIFEYLYGNKNAIGIKKDVFFNLVEKKSSSMYFSPDKPLNLQNVASSSAYTGQTKERIAELTNEIATLTADREKKESNIARAKSEGNEKLMTRFTEERSLLNQAILRKLDEREKCEKQIRDLERATHFDLFNPAPDAGPKKEVPKAEVKPLPKPEPAPAPQKPQQQPKNQLQEIVTSLEEKIKEAAESHNLVAENYHQAERSATYDKTEKDFSLIRNRMSKFDKEARKYYDQKIKLELELKKVKEALIPQNPPAKPADKWAALRTQAMQVSNRLRA